MLPENTRNSTVYPTDQHPNNHPLWNSNCYHGYYQFMNAQKFIHPIEIFDLWYDLLWKTLNINPNLCDFEFYEKDEKYEEHTLMYAIGKKYCVGTKLRDKTDNRIWHIISSHVDISDENKNEFWFTIHCPELVESAILDVRKVTLNQLKEQFEFVE